MKEWPEFNNEGDLPPGIHQATLAEVISHFGNVTVGRQIIARRLKQIYNSAASTGHLARFIIFGSFITAKPDPGDVDVFLLMENDFDMSLVSEPASIIFDHISAQNYEGASIFWLRRLAALEGESATINHWQVKRNGNLRGIVEVIADD